MQSLNNVETRALEKSILESYEDILITEMGAWFQGERVVFRGRDLFNDLNEKNWMDLLLFGITGRDFDARQITLFERIWTLCTSYPEPRIWNNRIAALGGTARTTACLAISAATAISEASIYGRRPDIRAIDFLFRAKKHIESGGDLGDLIKREFKTYGVILGFGRPIIERDERIGPILQVANELGLDQGEYVRLAQEIESTILQNHGGPRMNVAAILAALAADQGMDTQDYYRFMILSFSAGMFPCYIDAFNKAEGSFFPLRCERIMYLGKSPRTWSTVD